MRKNRYMKKILFFGFGNMGQAIASGLLEKTGLYEIEAVDPYFYEQGSPVDGVTLYKGAKDIQQKFDMVILAVKPQIAEKIYGDLSGILKPEGVALSIMAGVERKQIVNYMQEGAHVVRAMPNTPAAIGMGVSVLVSDKNCPKATKLFCEDVLKAVGKVFWVQDEAQMHAVTAVSGSGPAYFFALMDYMIKAGEALGLPENLARELACETARGAGSLAVKQMQCGKYPLQLKEEVISKGGTTEAALNVFNKNQFDRIVFDALLHARDRSKELSL